VFFGQTHSQAGLGAAATYSNSNFNKRWSITEFKPFTLSMIGFYEPVARNVSQNVLSEVVGSG
jgi:hypothetical protein